METIAPFKRENSKSSFTDDDELSRMSDLESEYRDNNIRRMSLSSSLPASPSASSYNKMSVDSDDARSVSSTSRRDNHTMETSAPSPSTTLPSPATTPNITTTTRVIRPIGSSWANLSTSNNIRQQDELYMVDSSNMSKRAAQTKSSYDLRERRDPERRSVNRRSSLLVSFGFIKFFLKSQYWFKQAQIESSVESDRSSRCKLNAACKYMSKRAKLLASIGRHTFRRFRDEKGAWDDCATQDIRQWVCWCRLAKLAL